MSVLLRAVALVLALALGLTWLLLRATAAADDATFAAVQASLDRLDHLVAQQEDLTETFKSANAQLQDSLTYFDTISAGISQSDPAVASLIGELGTAVLHLTRDPSAPVVAQAGQLLATLDALAARTQAARAARRFQVALYLIALLLLAVLARAGWRLRAAARALERRAALEHRIAAVSTHFIGCPPD